MLEWMEESDEVTRTLPMSGALRAWTLVVEMSSVGREMRLRLIVPVGYLTLPSRTGMEILS